MKKKKEAVSKIDVTNLALLPIRQYNDEISAFILKDGTYFDLIEKLADDIDNMMDDERQYLMIEFAKFLKMYKKDINILSLNFRTNLILQKKYLYHKLKNTNENTRRVWIERSIEEMENAEQGTKKREYYILYHADTLDELSEIRKVFTILKKGVREVDKEKKLKVIYQISNMNSIVPVEVI